MKPEYFLSPVNDNFSLNVSRIMRDSTKWKKKIYFVTFVALYVRLLRTQGRIKWQDWKFCISFMGKSLCLIIFVINLHSSCYFKSDWNEHNNPKQVSFVCMMTPQSFHTTFLVLFLITPCKWAPFVGFSNIICSSTSGSLFVNGEVFLATYSCSLIS